MGESYKPPEHRTFALPGRSGRVAMDMAVRGLHRTGKAKDYDLVVLGKLAEVLSGGDADVIKPLTENEVLKLEYDHFMTLVRDDRTLNRITTMLETGKPLRN